MGVIMTRQYQQTIDWLAQPANLVTLQGIGRGIEREALRIDQQGRLAQTPHPKALGSALTHPAITTDYAENLLELITPVARSIEQVFSQLATIHNFVGQQLENEWLWAASMPCAIADQLQVPIAQYGSSHMGQLKHIYRRGLGYRYNRIMQVIAGIHYNFSLPADFWSKLATKQGISHRQQDWQSAQYFALIRNFRRYSWLIYYLLGASPAVDASFIVNHQARQLMDSSEDTLFAPYSTCLRMSDIGYRSLAQASLDICYNSLPEYIHSLRQAVATSYPPYEKIGVKVSGEYNQLNANLLQIENEYYSAVRPKRVANSGEHPSQALARAGVEYIEVRSVDIDPFASFGLQPSSIAFLDLLLTYCLLQPSPQIAISECREIAANQCATIWQGRRPDLTLSQAGQTRPLQEWGQAICQQMQPLAQLLDQANRGQYYQQSLAEQLAKLADPQLTPSAKVLAAMTEQKLSFQTFAWQQSQLNTQAIKDYQADQQVYRQLSQQVKVSLAEQADLEQQDNQSNQSFEAFLADYFAYYI
jgi:glutamate--cysteine ligase